MYMSMQNDKHVGEQAAYLSPADLEKRWNVSKSLVYKIVHSEGFPAPLRLGTNGANGKSLRFSRSSIEDWERNNTERPNSR
jgi:predicted DNA-binding transcriptional regulator AlpA